MSQRLILLAALGYFVDILDLFLFSVLRIPSIRSLGVAEADTMSAGTLLLNCQMAGLLLGSFFWGIIGDKKGRLSVLYGSILLYSLATLANAFVTSINQYAVLRFLAGIGLAGELGAAITVVSESLPRTQRGIGTTLVAGIGLCGGIAASLMAQYFTWKVCYLIGGGMGLLLLILRLRLFEPEMFLKMAPQTRRGDLLLLVESPKRLKAFLCLICTGMPIWFVGGILMIFSPELGKTLKITGEPITAANAVLYSYVGMAIGDFACGFLSQWFQRRKTVVRLFLVAIGVCVCLYLTANEQSELYFYTVCFAIGFGTGYWAVLMTMAAENFGTNLRATVATTVPNLIRGSVIPMTIVHGWLRGALPLLEATAILGAIVLVVGFVALGNLKETYATDLNFLEH